MASQKKIVDPTDGQIYKKRKLGDNSVASDQSHTSSKPIAPSPTCPSSGWGRLVPQNFDFTDVHIQDYIKNCGKKASSVCSVSAAQQKTCIRPETRGHRFFKGDYLADIWCQEVNDHLFFKGKCHPSQKANDPLHNIWCALERSSSYITAAYCSCVAGASGYCNHLVALLYQLREFSLTNTRNIPDDLAKTSKPQVWHKPRIEGIRAEPVMQCVVGCQERNNLTEVRNPKTIPNDELLTKEVQQQLREENPLYGFTYMASTEHKDTTYIPTSLQTHVPQGSVLSYQLSLTEANFSVECDSVSLHRYSCQQECIVRDVEFPKFPLSDMRKYPSKYTAPVEAKTFMNSIEVDFQAAADIERKTSLQASSPEWWQERKNRLTASHFAEICKKMNDKSKRKKNISNYIGRLRTQAPLERLPKPLKHGRDYEKVAIRRYMRYMRNIGHKVIVENSGLVVHQDMPYIACSPDGKVIDPVAHPHFGLLEVKCPYTYRGVTPKEAAALDDTFCLQPSKTLVPVLRLDRNHAYYCQVQGQMGVTGAHWCDFVVYTFRGLCIQRIPFDALFWEEMKHSLEKFFYEKYLPKVIT